MAVNTPLKRASCLNVDRFIKVLPIPDGSVDQEDRQMNAHTYSGILSGALDIANEFKNHLILFMTR